jgi:hypothetical protein
VCMDCMKEVLAVFVIVSATECGGGRRHDLSHRNEYEETSLSHVIGFQTCIKSLLRLFSSQSDISTQSWSTKHLQFVPETQNSTKTTQSRSLIAITIIQLPPQPPSTCPLGQKSLLENLFRLINQDKRFPSSSPACLSPFSRNFCSGVNML